MENADASDEPDAGNRKIRGEHPRAAPNRIVLESGRCCFYTDEQGALRAKRDGEPWESFAARQIILALFGELLIPEEVMSHHTFDVEPTTLFDASVDVEHEDEDPAFPVADWQADVMKGGTRLGYPAWIDSQLGIYE